MDQEIVIFPVSKARDPNGAILRDAMRTQVALEKARALRDLLLYLLAACGAPLWFVAMWPDLATRGFRYSALIAWVLCLFGLALQIRTELALRRRRSTYIDQLDPLRGQD